MMNRLQRVTEGAITTIKYCLDAANDVEYINKGGKWFTRVRDILYPVLAKIDSPAVALVSTEDLPLRMVWFEMINGKYEIQRKKFYSMEDYRIYDLNDFQLLNNVYFNLKCNVFSRTLVLDKQDRRTLGGYSYRTFDGKIFLLAEVLTDRFICREPDLRLTDTLVLNGSRHVDMRCKVFYLGEQGYGYWTEDCVVYVHSDKVYQIDRKQAYLSLSVRDKYYVLFTDRKLISKDIDPLCYHLGHKHYGIFMVFQKEIWEYLYSEAGSVNARSINAGEFVFSPALFHDYYIQGGFLYLVIGNGSVVSTCLLEFDELIESVSVAVLPMVSFLTVKVYSRLINISCTIVEGVLNCQELDSL